MISGLGIPFLLEASLSNLDVSLPRIGVFGEIVLPKSFFVVINFRPAECICAHCTNQQRDNRGGGNLGCALSPAPRVCDTRAKECEQRNVRKILEMIGNEGGPVHMTRYAHSRT